MSFYNRDQIDRLYAILAETTSQYRKGPEVTERMDGPIKVVDVYAMPPADEAPAGIELVDLVFLKIGVDKAKAEARRDELVEILDAYPAAGLKGGPSYMSVGAVIGDQGAAFQLFALGEVLGLWKVVTPALFGLTGSEALEAAGAGFVMIDGYRPLTSVSTTPI